MEITGFVKLGVFCWLAEQLSDSLEGRGSVVVVRQFMVSHTDLETWNNFSNVQMRHVTKNHKLWPICGAIYFQRHSNPSLNFMQVTLSHLTSATLQTYNSAWFLVVSHFTPRKKTEGAWESASKNLNGWVIRRLQKYAPCRASYYDNSQFTYKSYSLVAYAYTNPTVTFRPSNLPSLSIQHNDNVTGEYEYLYLLIIREDKNVLLSIVCLFYKWR